MKNIAYMIICLMGLTTIAQNRQIEFIEADWKTHLSIAKKENKLIFFDAYTSWCGPCKMMAKNVFTKDEVADLFNSKFINAKYDMEKGEGPALKDKYGVSAYPTYLFIDGEGELVHKFVGGMSVKEFLAQANNALNPENTIYGLAKAFEASGHSESSAIAYLDALDKAYESNKKSIVSKIYFDSLEKQTLFEEHNWKLASKYLNNPSSKAFSYLFSNKEKLKGIFDSNEVENYFQQVFSFSVPRIKDAFAKNKELKEAKENAQAIRRLLTNEVSYSKVILAKLDLIEYAASNQWGMFAKRVSKVCADDEFPHKSYVVIEAAHDIVTSNQKKQYKDVLKWANILEKTKPELFTQIQLAELRKRVFIRMEKTAQANEMAQKEKVLRKEATDKRLMQPPLKKD